MYKKKISFGILGLGRVIEKRLLKVFLDELKNSVVEIVFDKNKKKSKTFSRHFKCVNAKNLNQFLSHKVDFVYIATESGNHYSHIKKCFDANQNVIVEKPPVLKVNQLLELNKIAKEKKLKFYSVFQNRLNKSIQFVKNYVLNKKNLVYVTLNLSWARNQSYYKDWHGNWKMDGGVIAQQGIHYIDILIYLFGKPIKCISTIANKSNKLQAEDTHNSLIVFKNNLSCTCNFTTALRPNDYEASIKIYTKESIINLDGLCCNKVSNLNFTKKMNKKINLLCKRNSEKVSNGYGNSHTKVLQNIIDLEMKKKIKLKPLNAIDTLETIKLLNMMYMSVEKKKWIYSKSKNINSKLGN